MRIAALGFLVGFGLAGCHSSESCRLRHENERLERENAELRAETARLIKENQALAEASADDLDDEDDEDLSTVELRDPFDEPSRRQARDLMDPFPPSTEPNYERALQQAQDQYVHGYYKRAIQTASTVRNVKPAKAFRIIGASACFLKDEATAKKAYLALDKAGQQFLKYVCKSRNDIDL